MLSFTEKLILVLYKELYNLRYSCNTEEKLADGIVRIHLQAQKAIYLFSQRNIHVGDFGYLWDQRGPFSAELQDVLKELDQKHQDVEDFYKLYEKDSEREKSLLLTPVQSRRVTAMASALRPILLDGSLDGNCELMGSLVYLSRTIKPGQGFDTVNSELKYRKGYFSDDERNFSMWETLKQASVLSI